ncbi:MAG: macro domain-containing protein [bacterium]
MSFAGLSKCELPFFMEHVIGQIRNVTLKIAFGDMTKVKADAYIVPQFNSCASYGGVGGSVARAGAVKGIDEFAEFVSQKGEQKFGTTLLTKSHGGNSDKLLHVVSVGSSKEHEFDTVQSSIYNALTTAEQNGVKSIASPALGTGIIGNLTAEQSAKSTLSAIKQFADEGKNMDVSLVIYGNKSAYNDFVKTLSTKSYETATKEGGEKQFDMGRWIVGMQRDADANKKSGI